MGKARTLVVVVGKQKVREHYQLDYVDEQRQQTVDDDAGAQRAKQARGHIGDTTMPASNK